MQLVAAWRGNELYAFSVHTYGQRRTVCVVLVYVHMHSPALTGAGRSPSFARAHKILDSSRHCNACTNNITEHLSTYTSMQLVIPTRVPASALWIACT